jgi:hypothetical protein
MSRRRRCIDNTIGIRPLHRQHHWHPFPALCFLQILLQEDNRRPNN